VNPRPPALQIGETPDSYPHESAGTLEGEFYASPLIENGRIHTVDQSANYYVLDAKTGKTMLNRTLEFTRMEGAHTYPSPCLAGNLLYIGNDTGEMLILKTSEPSAVIGLSSLPRGSGATPAFSGTRIFIRGGKLLYCIGLP
jgi:outer membrane protein assembly factor BamB